MNYNTAGFKNWWLEKVGERESDFTHNKYTFAGTMLEEPILRTVEKERGGKMLISPPPFSHETHRKLVVNLDGIMNHENYEVKCSQYESVIWGKVHMHKWYEKQCQVQMFAAGLSVSWLTYYAMLPHEYENEFIIAPTIDPKRLVYYDVRYDEDWVKSTYLPAFKFLSGCMDAGKYPWEMKKP
jgi:hypothetical protein